MLEIFENIDCEFDELERSFNKIIEELRGATNDLKDFNDKKDNLFKSQQEIINKQGEIITFLENENEKLYKKLEEYYEK